MDCVLLACFATTAEDDAALVYGSFSHMVPQASEQWQRPAVKALVRTIHQELCDPELLGRLAPVCKELGTACVDEATRMLLGIDLPVEQVMPEERVLTDRSYRPKPSQKRPRGLFPRVACLRVLEGVRIRCDVNELAERLRALGAVLVAGDPDLVVSGEDAPSPEWDDDNRLVGPIWGLAMRFFVLDPWSEERTVASAPTCRRGVSWSTAAGRGRRGAQPGPQSTSGPGGRRARTGYRTGRT